MGRPGRKTHYEEELLSKLLDKSYRYLNNQFDSFSTDKKIHISLELIKRHMPAKLEHQGAVTVMPTIMVNNEPLEFDIGEKVES